MSRYTQSTSTAGALTKSPVEMTVLALQFNAMGEPAQEIGL